MFQMWNMKFITVNIPFGHFWKANLELIEYIYCEEIDINNGIAVDLLKLAHEYSLPSLIGRCGKCLAETIQNDNFLELASLADLYQAEELQTDLFNYLLNFKQSLFKVITPQELPRFLLERFISYSI